MNDTTPLTIVTGRHFDIDALRQLQAKAHRAYEANPHIFEDEFDAMVAIGAFPLRDSLRQEYHFAAGPQYLPAA